MALTVRIPAWSLDEDVRVLRVGDAYTSWLVLIEVDRGDHAPQLAREVHGHATALPAWAGGLLGRSPVRVDVGEAALYWDAPEPVSGPIDVNGWIEVNNVDAPPGFPRTTGTVAGVHLESVASGPGEWSALVDTAVYEQVRESELSWRWDSERDGRRLTAVVVQLEVGPRSSSV